MPSTILRAFCALIASFATIGLARAADLTIGLSSPITSLDPHFHNLTPNNQIARHVFETLIKQDEKQTALLPGLAESWKPLSDTEWEIKLRKGVKFHNGQDFTADDVIATFKRVPNVPNSPASFAIFVRPIVDIQTPDKFTLRLKTDKPHPLLPYDMVSVAILPKSVADGAKTEEFNSGKAMIGTGPYPLRRIRRRRPRRTETQRSVLGAEARMGQRALSDDHQRAGARCRAARR